MSTTGSLYAEIWRNEQWEPVPKPKYSKGKRIPVGFMRPGAWYELFAALFGYYRSNLYHLAHTEEIVPLSEPRGFPEDMNPIFQEYFSNHGYCLKHYLTWFMVQEVIDYDWDRTFPPCTGYVEREFSHFFDNSNSFPENFPDDRSVYVSKEEGRVEVTWIESYRDFVGCSDLDCFIEELMKLGDPRKVRIIFCLDSY